MNTWRIPLAQRFWAKVAKGEDCWLWTGSVRRDGYGYLGRGGTNGGGVAAHRASWEIAYGPIPGGLWVLHHCDNKRCVRPEHLFLGTHDDNMADMRAKDRQCNSNRRKTHCKRGHPFDAVNTYRSPNGQRTCRICQRAAVRRWAREHPAIINAGQRRRYWENPEKCRAKKRSK